MQFMQRSRAHDNSRQSSWAGNVKHIDIQVHTSPFAIVILARINNHALLTAAASYSHTWLRAASRRRTCATIQMRHGVDSPAPAGKRQQRQRPQKHGCLRTRGLNTRLRPLSRKVMFRDATTTTPTTPTTMDPNAVCARLLLMLHAADCYTYRVVAVVEKHAHQPCTCTWTIPWHYTPYVTRSIRATKTK